MSGVLRVSLKAEGDGSGELFVYFKAEGFSGHSSAWFDLASLEKEIEKFLAFPLPADNYPSIKGGYWNRDFTHLEQEHVYLSANPKGGTGNLVLLVRLATPSENTGNAERRFCASGELRASYEQLTEFVRDFKLLLHGAMEEVVFYEQA